MLFLNRSSRSIDFETTTNCSKFGKSEITVSKINFKLRIIIKDMLAMLTNDEVCDFNVT